MHLLNALAPWAHITHISVNETKTLKSVDVWCIRVCMRVQFHFFLSSFCCLCVIIIERHIRRAFTKVKGDIHYLVFHIDFCFSSQHCFSTMVLVVSSTCSCQWSHLEIKDLQNKMFLPGAACCFIFFYYDKSLWKCAYNINKQINARTHTCACAHLNRCYRLNDLNNKNKILQYANVCWATTKMN